MRSAPGVRVGVEWTHLTRAAKKPTMPKAELPNLMNVEVNAQTGPFGVWEDWPGRRLGRRSMGELEPSMKH